MEDEYKPMKQGKLVEEDGRKTLLTGDNKTLAAENTTILLWSLCNGQRTIDEIRQEMTDKLNIKKDLITTELISKSIQELKNIQLIK
ncbi:MAG: hypothetical protein GF416_08085 [Candidatus Altiarchaeales archaeon]|nr:hypothetical protein [Candidatus Altiarchaeales archaeon]MBD3417073.1 hypothetical protein [Candidatus Altiarchaeales archaeon]